MVAKISLREAVKHFDVSRPTLQKALKSGKISGVQDGQGHWTIDPSELARVYRARSTLLPSQSERDRSTFTRQNTDLTVDIEALRAKLAEAEQRAAVAEALAEERSKHIEDLRKLLPAPAKTSSWWPWGRK